jgi:PAS domain S-box-containing protein
LADAAEIALLRRPFAALKHLRSPATDHNVAGGKKDRVESIVAHPRMSVGASQSMNSLFEEANESHFAGAGVVPGDGRSTILFEGQKRILAMLARGEPVDEVLAELCRAAEAVEPKATAAILVLDRDNKCFDRGIAPTAGPGYCAALAGAPVGPPHVGTCAAAVFRGEPVTSVDVANDERWTPAWRELHLGHNMRACQSTPILATDGRALGTFVLAFSEPSNLGAWDAATIALLVQLAALALERMRAVEDVKELNRTLEERVAERTRERDRIWNVSQDALLVTDADGKWLSVNPAWTSVLGWSEAELLGKTAAWIEHLDDCDSVTAVAARLASGVKTLRFESRLRHQDGAYRWLSWTAVPEDGRIYYVARDVSEEKVAAAALRLAEEQLRHAQKMDAVGQLTSGLAHDFNNILSAILGNLELVGLRVGDESLHRMLQAATRAAERGGKLTEQLLVFARKHPVDLAAVDLAGALTDMSEMLRRTLGGATAVQAAFGDDLWAALADAIQLEVAILNLALNARDAMPSGGVVLIAARNVKASDTDKPPGLAPGDYVAVSVADTGTGMTEEVSARALEPFFTTKGPGKGTGLGLSQVYGFAKQSGGDLRIKSAPGRGTTVELFLPRATVVATPAAATGVAAVAPGRGDRATVLVVDDQEDVRDVMLAYLETLGHPTVQASSGRLAVDLLNSGAAPAIDLLLVDYAMPGLSGIEVARSARASNPDLPIIIVTGYADTKFFDDWIDGAQLLRKPCRLHELAAAIEAALARRRQPPTNILSMTQRRS